MSCVSRVVVLIYLIRKSSHSAHARPRSVLLVPHQFERMIPSGEPVGRLLRAERPRPVQPPNPHPQAGLSAGRIASERAPASRFTVWHRMPLVVAGLTLFLLSSPCHPRSRRGSHPRSRRWTGAFYHMVELKSRVYTCSADAFLSNLDLDRVWSGLLSSSWATLAARRRLQPSRIKCYFWI